MLNVLSPVTVLIGTLAVILTISLAFEAFNREAILLVFVVALAILYGFRDTYLGGLSDLAVSRDWKAVALVVLFTLAALHIHTVEVLAGLGRAILSSAYLAGHRLGHALAGL